MSSSMSIPPAPALLRADVKKGSCVIIRVYAPELEKATTLQRLAASLDYESVLLLAGDNDFDDSASLTNFSSPSRSSAGMSTPPTSLESVHRPIGQGKSTDVDNTLGYNRVSTGIDWTVSGSILPTTQISTLDPLRRWTRGRAAYFMLAEIGPGTFRMFLDTGSNTTWVRRRNYGMLDHGRNVPVVTQRRHQVYDGDPPVPADNASMSRRGKTITYMDGCQAMIYQYPLTHDTRLPYTTSLQREECNRGIGQRRSQPIRFHYQYALALAVNSRLENDPTDGMIALGLAPWQGDTEHVVPSFLDTIANSVTAPGDNKIGPGVLMYIGLRFIPLLTPPSKKPLYQSFYTFNGWPCENVPAWSNEISVVPSSESGVEYDLWVVALVGMSITTQWNDNGRLRTHISQIPLSAQSPKATDRKATETLKSFIPGRSDQGKKGEASWKEEKGRAIDTDEAPKSEPKEVLLDTGCSLSFLPEATIRAIAAHFSGDVRQSRDQTTYTIPISAPGVNKRPDRDTTTVVLRFRGQSKAGEQIVEVTVPALYFLYAPALDKGEALESLIYCNPKSEKSCVLGVNFFHVSWVAMVKPAMGPPFVSIAPQFSTDGEVARYQLPPQASLFGH